MESKGKFAKTFLGSIQIPPFLFLTLRFEHITPHLSNLSKQEGKGKDEHWIERMKVGRARVCFFYSYLLPSLDQSSCVLSFIVYSIPTTP